MAHPKSAALPIAYVVLRILVILNWLYGAAVLGLVIFANANPAWFMKAIDVPVLVIHSKDDQIVPYDDSGPLSAKLLKNGTLKTYEDLPHGLCQTHPEIVNADILDFLRADTSASREEEAPVLIVEPIPVE
jgi:pimeloyl-ACP methyl ester carboxylesterase